MDVASAVASLPEPYRRALRDLAEGADEERLARSLDIPAASVHPFVQLAVAKLGSLLSAETDGHAPLAL